MSYDDHLLGQHAIDVRTEAALSWHDYVPDPPERDCPYDWDDEEEWYPGDVGYPCNADEYAEQESENHQANELDSWPYDDAGYLTQLTEQFDIHWEDM